MAAMEAETGLAAARRSLAAAEQVKRQVEAQVPTVKEETAVLGWLLQDDRLAERLRVALRLRFGGSS